MIILTDDKCPKLLEICGFRDEEVGIVGLGGWKPPPRCGGERARYLALLVLVVTSCLINLPQPNIIKDDALVYSFVTFERESRAMLIFCIIHGHILVFIDFFDAIDT